MIVVIAWHNAGVTGCNSFVVSTADSSPDGAKRRRLLPRYRRRREQTGSGPVRPSRDEVRAITEQHAEKLIELMDALSSAPQSQLKHRREQIEAEIAKYAEDFGASAAERLRGHVKREVAIRRSDVRRR